MVNPGWGVEGSNVVPISKANEIRARRTQLRGVVPLVSRATTKRASTGPDHRQAPDPPFQEPQDKLVHRSTCEYLLNNLASMPLNLVERLEIPEIMLMAGDVSSFTADGGKHASALAHALAWGEKLPEHIPHYGICFFRKDDRKFCLLVDQRRKIMVMEEFYDAKTTQSPWERFEKSLEIACERAAQAGGKLEHLIIVREGRLEEHPWETA